VNLAREVGIKIDLDTLQQRLRQLADASDGVAWPGESLNLLKQADCFKTAIPAQYGGSALDSKSRIDLYAQVAGGSLSIALILTQHDGACELITEGSNAELAARLLPEVAAGRLLATLGISQLTTSRQGPKPAMLAEPFDDGFRLTGLMPWVTSARYADRIVVGAALPDGRQILACVPTDTAGLTVAAPMQFMALTDSWTSEVRCQGVFVAPDELIRGPMERVLARRSPVKSLTVSAVGMGLAGAILDGIRQASARTGPPVADFANLAAERYRALRNRINEAALLMEDPSAEVPSMDIRVQVNDLTARLATTYLTLSKGTGYRASHPAGRLLREAMFFLVWSAPPRVQEGTMKQIWGSELPTLGSV